MTLENQIRKAYNAFKLGNSLFRSEYMMTKSEVENIPVHEKIMKRECAYGLGEEILKRKDLFSIRDEPNGDKIATVEVLLFPVEELKSIVEYCIQTMPMSAIEEIRK